ncbi:P-loop NTPase fold protein [Schinkia azotoformans]|uniref:KAP family P-loop NTPase fold protein n=1 Tax=Schinkia azotoformans TaxID=1454 RepID=UPI002DB9DE27|nr:P-loop NTPase fold protein [Schinkia azotoformans]MEC1714858.1 P-loop NTPase fold protein [Schinkia azotoformans]
MRYLFQIILYSFVSILLIAKVEPFLNVDFLSDILKVDQIIIYITVGLSMFLFMMILVGASRNKFITSTQPFSNFRHRLLFSFSIAIIINYMVTGEQGNNSNNLLFSTLFYVSLLYLYILFIIVLMRIEKSLEKVDRKEMTSSPFNDDPISQKSNDILNRTAFSNHIAEQILKYNDKIVIGLYGPWGAGKSSILGLIKENIPKSQAVVNFKPWYFGENNHEIIPSFIKLLAEELDKYHDFQHDLKKLLLEYAAGFQNITYRSGGVSFKFGDIFHNFFESQQSISAIKDKIEIKLNDSNQKIIVFIDEIDRLDPAEIQILFKLVRLVCDFPKVIYVLALDEEVVSQSLGMFYTTKLDNKEKVKENGRKYLEKFIQIPIYLPAVDSLRLKQFVLTEIETFLSEQCIKSNFINENVSEIYPLLLQQNWRGTLRNYKRYINLVKFFVPFLKDEIFIDDLLYLLFLKVFEPALYDYIRDNPSVFLKEQKEIDIETKGYFQKFNHVEKVIIHLFPNIANYFDAPVRPRVINTDLPNSHLFISEPKYFPKYFMYGTAYQEISEIEMKRLRKEINHSDTQNAIQALITFEEIYGLNKIINKISSDAPMLSEDEICSITEAFKKRYYQLDQFQQRNEIVRMLSQIYRNKQQLFFKSVLINEKPIPLFLTISIGEILAIQSRNRPEIEEGLYQILKGEFESYTLESVFSKLTLPEREWIFIKWLEKEDNNELKCQKIAEYVKSIQHFSELVEYIWVEYNKTEPYIILLEILRNFGVNISKKYLIEYDRLDELQERKEILIELKKHYQDIYNYIYYELSLALENSKKGNFSVIIKPMLEKMIDILQSDKTSKEDMDPILEILEEIKAYNLPFLSNV